MQSFKLHLTHTIHKTCELPYQLTLPEGYEPDGQRAWPLILFLHGAGERGTDLTAALRYGIPKVAVARKKFPFVTLTPQCPPNTWWSDWIPALDQLLIQTEGDYRIDPKRIYLTGLSMGGFGTWHMAVEYPNRFAAVVPICGGGAWHYGFPQRVRVLKHVPIWVFHGAQDPVVPLNDSQILVDELKRARAKVKFTIYPDGGHNVWTRTYNNGELYEWMLSHSLP